MPASHNAQDDIDRAILFAAKVHGGQLTPDGLPYITHLMRVMAEAMAACNAQPELDRGLVGVLSATHDTVEDTGTTAEDVATEFGSNAGLGVAALSKDPNRPKSERMADSLRRILATGIVEVAVVKLADRVVNMSPPPRHWTRDKCLAYRAEGQEILSTLGYASPLLAHRLEARIDAYGNFLPPALAGDADATTPPHP